MARAYFYNIPHHGHITPTLPLVQELVRQGDEVVYFAGRDFAAKVQATGATFRDYGVVSAFDPARRKGHVIQQGGLVAEATHELLPTVLEQVAAEQPDYLIFDMSAPWAGIAARHLDIPAVVVFPHLPFYWRSVTEDRRVLRKVLNSVRPGQGYWRDLQRQIGRMVTEHGLRRPADLNILSSSAELNIVFTSRTFQPYAERFGEQYEFVGPVVDLDRPEQEIEITREPGQKLIYIAVGTVYQAQAGFFHTCMAALADSGYRVIMSTGRAVDPGSLDPIPANFTVGQFMPQLQILRQADLFVTHGGMNSIAEAMMLRVPLIVVPNTLEQAVNAGRVEQLGAGRYLPPRELTAASLRTAVDSLLDDAGVAGAVERIRDSFVSAGGVERAAAAIVAFKTQYGVGKNN